MPTIQVLTPPTQADEPVTPALLSAHERLDLDVSSTDPAIQAQVTLAKIYGAAARQMVEQYTGRYFAAQTVQLTFELGERYQLPHYATATAVAGFYTALADLENAPAYLVEYQKGISVSRELDWCQALRQTYTVTATIAPTQVDPAAMAAMLELAGEMYRNRETSAETRGIQELPVSWRVKLAHLVVNPIGY